MVWDGVGGCEEGVGCWMRMWGRWGRVNKHHPQEGNSHKDDVSQLCYQYIPRGRGPQYITKGPWSPVHT